MRGHDSYSWRTRLSWRELVAIAESVLETWNTATRFVSRLDQREHLWTVRHDSVAQPFLVFNEDSLHGSLPREGNPLAMLLLLGMTRLRPGCLDISFANGRALDLSRFEITDLTNLLPQATLPAHRKLAALSIALQPPAPAET